ncbi:hypothetical protein QWY90_13505 [Flavobacterium paronense]|uniref:Uncharacterized protein n=1 Tax=Flavobacterium paronense TaxID=1392775 RepID=A0ABV5GFG0_9FLAO|nr:hypothetical protein [Flavobacterium paronense]MDN3678324.1 hypothetical protein [Flavobacterium paronense]
MPKKLTLLTVISWLLALVIWQLIFNTHPVVSEILWEIHTIFTSVILFYLVLNAFVKEATLDFIKICFRIIFKVWLIIFIAFSMHNSFNQKGFVLTSTFIFGYLEGLIDVNAWLRSRNFTADSKIGTFCKTKSDKIAWSIISISTVHLLCAFIALIFFSID